MQRVRAIFRELRSRSGVNAGLRVGGGWEFPTRRDFAYCKMTGDLPWITVSPSLEHQSEDRIRGVLAHEFGHAVYGNRNHAEKDADAWAVNFMDGKYGYDADGVEIARYGAAPRPDWLPR